MIWRMSIPIYGIESWLKEGYCMKETEGSLSLLIAELEADLTALEVLEDANTRATLRIETGAAEDLLDDLRSFHHVFRNMYRKNLS